MNIISTTFLNIKSKIVCFFKEIYLRIKLKTPLIANRVRILCVTLGGYGTIMVSNGLDMDIPVFHTTLSISKICSILGVIGTVCTSLMVENKDDLKNAMQKPLSPTNPSDAKSDNI